MDESAREFNRRLFFAPDLFPPLSAIVHAELGAGSRRGDVHPVNTDHYLVLKLGRSQETVLTSLPPDAIAKRFDEFAYAMVVADGMGALGQVASGLAIAALMQLTLRQGQWRVRVDDVIAPDIVARIMDFYRQIDSALVSVNRSGVTVPLYSTLSAVVSGGRDLFFAHVGHSRAYLLRARELIQLTRDHTHAVLREKTPAHLVDLSGAASDLHHLLTDALGAGTVDPQIDVERLTLADRDVVMLCTNGLTDALGEPEIAAILEAHRPAQDLCDTLVSRAVGAGAQDDVTVLVARYHVPE
jgi:serine/threonine protein phosphatase PrpC